MMVLLKSNQFQENLEKEVKLLFIHHTKVLILLVLAWALKVQGSKMLLMN